MWLTKKHPTHKPAIVELLVFAVFAFVVIFGMRYAFKGFSTARREMGGAAATSAKRSVPARVAPTADAYMAETRGVMSPFLAVAEKMTAADFGGDTSSMRALAAKTKERMIAVVVPKEYRDAHLAMTLLLDQWTRALDGAAADQQTVPQKTADVVKANAWLVAATPVKK